MNYVKLQTLNEDIFLFCVLAFGMACEGDAHVLSAASLASRQDTSPQEQKKRQEKTLHNFSILLTFLSNIYDCTNEEGVEGTQSSQSNTQANLILFYTRLNDNSVRRCIAFVRFKCK